MSESYRFKPAPDAKCTCDTKRDLELALQGQKVAPCARHRPEQLTGPGIGLGFDDATVTALTGIPVTSPQHDQPLDAA